jgi:NAD(P)-dependent dehydrogenase (short-subunit alcohol dehydrogenase family)
MMSRLNGKIALVTGGGTGIGRAIALRFAKEGAYVFIAGRRQTELDEAVALAGHNIEAVQADVTNSADLDRLFKTIAEKKGRLDIVAASAGVADHSNLTEVTEAHFDKIFDLNARALLFTVQKAVPLMTQGGSVVLVGSNAGSMGVPGYGVYSATKAVTRSFARTWTGELAKQGIRVNNLSPGPTDTAMFAQASDEVRQGISDQIPLGRLARPEEIAAAALFLASDESSFVAGIDLVVDGGLIQVL